MSESPQMNPSRILPRFDEYVHKAGESFEAVLIGAGALNVMGVITRQAIDFDILKPENPEKIMELALTFRLEMEKDGISLIKKWLNNGPESLTRDLPDGWMSRTQTIFTGKAITLHTLGRPDLLKSKLFAYCDRDERDLGDLLALKPTSSELKEALPWLSKRDGNPGWPAHVEGKVKTLAKDLGHEL